MVNVVSKQNIVSLFEWLGHHYPLYSGCGKISNHPFFRWLLNSESQTTRWATLKDQSEILSLTNDWIGNSLYLFGDLDPKLSWFCRKLLSEGDTVLDVGANIGLVTLIASKLVGTSGEIHAFEPQPRLVSMMNKSIAKNKRNNITVHNIALGEEEGEMELFVPKSNSGAASLMDTIYDDGDSFMVPVKNGSDYFSSLDLNHVRFMKMDVEGFESTVIRGAFQFLQKNRPDAIVFELLDHHNPLRENEVIQQLQELSYQFYDFIHPYVGISLRKLDLASNSLNYGHDIVALTPETARELGL